MESKKMDKCKTKDCDSDAVVIPLHWSNGDLCYGCVSKIEKEVDAMRAEKGMKANVLMNDSGTYTRNRDQNCIDYGRSG